MKITKSLIVTMVAAMVIMMNCGTKRCVTGDKADAVKGAQCVDSKCQTASYSGTYRNKSDGAGTVCIFDADNCKTSANPADVADPSKKVALEDGSCAEW